MDSRVKESLQDVLFQAREIRAFTDGMAFEAYQADSKTQAAVERKFEIIGEALNRIRTTNEDVLREIRDCRSIISFRNILALGYDTIEDRIVWGIIENDLAGLMDDVERLLG